MIEIIEGPPRAEHLKMFCIIPLGRTYHSIDCANCGRVVENFMLRNPEQNNFQHFLNLITDHIDKFHRAAEEN